MKEHCITINSSKSNAREAIAMQIAHRIVTVPVTNTAVVLRNDLASHRINTRKETNIAALMYYAISHIRNDHNAEGSEIKPITFWWEDFTGLMPMSKQSCALLLQKALAATITFIDQETTKRVTEPIFTTSTWKAGSITLAINQRLAPYLLNLSEKFTIVPLNILLKLRGTHQRALFWYLATQDNRTRKRVGITLNDMVEICRLPKSKANIHEVNKVIKGLNTTTDIFGSVRYDNTYGLLLWGT